MSSRRTDPKSKSVRFDPNSSRSQATTKTSYESRSKTAYSTSSSFAFRAFQNGILNSASSKPPANLEFLQERIDRSRATPSPTESYYKVFADSARKARNEQTVLLETSHLLKRYGELDLGYTKDYNQAFTEFPKNVGFNNGLSSAKPDFVEGLRITEFDPFPVCEELGGAAVPALGMHAIALQHFAGEWKGPAGHMTEAQHQAAYDGACMVYGRNEARSLLDPDPAGHAYVQTFTIDGTNLNTFAHYSSESQGKVKYHQYLTSESALHSSYEVFKKARRRLRNLQDYAKETSEKLRDELVEKHWANQRLIEGDDGEDSPIYLHVPAETADPADDSLDEYEDGEDQVPNYVQNTRRLCR